MGAPILPAATRSQPLPCLALPAKFASCSITKGVCALGPPPASVHTRSFARAHIIHTNLSPLWHSFVALSGFSLTQCATHDRSAGMGRPSSHQYSPCIACIAPRHGLRMVPVLFDPPQPTFVVDPFSEPHSFSRESIKISSEPVQKSPALAASASSFCHCFLTLSYSTPLALSFIFMADPSLEPTYFLNVHVLSQWFRLNF